MANKRVGVRGNEALAHTALFGSRRTWLRRATAADLRLKLIVVYRTAENRQRFHRIGRHGALWTPDMARKEARRVR